MIANNEKFARLIKKQYVKLSVPAVSWTWGQLIFLISNYFLKPRYPIVYIWLRSLKFIPRMISAEERQGIKPSVYPALMPDVLAKLILRQLPKLDKLNECKEEAASIYYNILSKKGVKLPRKFPGRVYLKFNVQISTADEIIKKAAKKHLDLTRMFSNVIGPSDANLTAVGYSSGACPVAEKVARNSLDLPVGILIDKRWARKIALFINSNIK